ncbi:MAG TPA: hypothetical protein VK866_16830 [Acidimicrobiales bacterium]|nr:hypothetical protein [Acidimicrobiales bacterium]
MPHLDEDTVAALLDPDEVADVTAQVFAELGRGEAATTVRVRARTPGAMASAMAAAVPSLGVTGGKVYATVDGRFTFHVVLFDLEGRVLCTLDGGPLTDVRTPALSAVAIDHLARPGARTAAVLGTGRAARPHLEMLARRLPLDEVRVWGRRSDAAAALAAAGEAAGAPVTVADTAEAAVDGVDVVVTVTSANEPVVDADAIADHALVCAVGATKPERCELDPQLFARAAAVVTDSIEGAPAECGDLQHAVAAGTFAWDRLVDLADLLAGRVEVPRAGIAGPVVFETQGVAIQDVAAGALVWRRHQART